MMSDRSVTWSCAAAVEDANDDTRALHTTAARHMRLTILHAFLLLLAAAGPARAQPARDDTPFDAHRWHFEVDGQAAIEAWNYNISHEELYALGEGLTYGVKDGLVLRASQRFAYVSQRAEDAILLGLTIGVRGRVYQRGRLAAFLQGDVGVSHTAVAT